MTKKQLIKEFREKFFTVHDGCDDGYYACPKSEDYFGRYGSKPIGERPCFCHVENTKPKIEAFLLSAFDAGRASGIEEGKVSYIKSVLLDFHKARLDGAPGYDFFFKLQTDLDSLTHSSSKDN